MLGCDIVSGYLHCIPARKKNLWSLSAGSSSTTFTDQRVSGAFNLEEVDDSNLVAAPDSPQLKQKVEEQVSDSDQSDDSQQSYNETLNSNQCAYEQDSLSDDLKKSSEDETTISDDKKTEEMPSPKYVPTPVVLKDHQVKPESIERRPPAKAVVVREPAVKEKVVIPLAKVEEKPKPKYPIDMKQVNIIQAKNQAAIVRKQSTYRLDDCDVDQGCISFGHGSINY